MPERDLDAFLTVSDSVQRDLAYLARRADALPHIANVIAQTLPGAQPVPGAELARIIGPKINLSPDDAQHILFTIWNLYRLKKGLHVDATKLVDDLTTSLDDQASEKWKAEYGAKWEAARKDVVSLLEAMTDEHPLVVSSKAAELGQAHQNILVKARIVTDVRPVFNAAGDKVLESLIIHSLLLNYFDGVETRRLEFALDANDIAELRRLCERAESKAGVLRTGLKVLPWVTTVLGEGEPVETVDRAEV
jgi:hypothetical protein